MLSRCGSKVANSSGCRPAMGWRSSSSTVRKNRRSVRWRSAAHSRTTRACKVGSAFTVDRSVVW